MRQPAPALEVRSPEAAAMAAAASASAGGRGEERQAAMNLSLRRSSRRLDALVDEFLESYVSWREACENVRAAYERWGTSKPPERSLAFGWYRAALDREECAAQVHSRLVAQLSRRL
jgi:uncharacterized protein YqiB (DUF1249 family)